MKVTAYFPNILVLSLKNKLQFFLTTAKKKTIKPMATFESDNIPLVLTDLPQFQTIIPIRGLPNPLTRQVSSMFRDYKMSVCTFTYKTYIFIFFIYFCIQIFSLPHIAACFFLYTSSTFLYFLSKYCILKSNFFFHRPQQIVYG